MSTQSDKLKKEIEDFLKKHPEPVNCTEEFMNDLESINNGLLNLELTFTHLQTDSSIFTIINHASDIMMYIQIADIVDPLNKSAFVIYTKLSYIILRLKSIYVPELIDDKVKKIQSFFLFDFQKEQNLCDDFVEKLEEFKLCSNAEELQLIVETFTLFLLEYLKFLSRIEEVPLKRTVKLLLKVADAKLLLENIHLFLHVIPKSKKITLLKKLTNFCIETNFNLSSCPFVKSTLGESYKLEVGTLCYFTIQHICKILESKNIHQTSKILAVFTDEETIYLTDSTMYNTEFIDIYDESANMFTFKKYKKINNISSQEIQKCIDILQLLLLNTYSGKRLKNCPFATIFLSMQYDLIMATDIDKSTTMSLMNLVNGFVEDDYIPSRFKAISYAFTIYQKLKFDHDLEIKSKNLCKILSKHYCPLIQLKCVQNNMDELINCDGDWIDKSIVLAYFLSNINPLNNEYTVGRLFSILNDNVLLASPNAQLLYPFSISLHASIVDKNDKYMVKNLAVLNDYLNILTYKNITVNTNDKVYFLNTILQHHKEIAHCLPNEFLIKCWECLLNPKNADIDMAKKILNLCSSKNLAKFIDCLKIETMKAITENDSDMTENYCSFLNELWTLMLNMQFMKKKKKIRKDHINHFCFILNKTFLFTSKKNQTNQGFILLLKIICSLLKVSWVNRTILINCALRVVTLVESHPYITECTLTEAAELLIVLYKCPNNSIKPFLGLYIITFANLVKKCWMFITDLPITDKLCNKQLLQPFHKLDKCSNLFEPNKQDFNVISRYIIADLIQLLTMNKHLPHGFMTYFYNILFNLMDVCSRDEMMQLLTNVKGPSLLILSRAYEEYRSNVRFSGRL